MRAAPLATVLAVALALGCVLPGCAAINKYTLERAGCDTAPCGPLQEGVDEALLLKIRFESAVDNPVVLKVVLSAEAGAADDFRVHSINVIVPGGQQEASVAFDLLAGDGPELDEVYGATVLVTRDDEFRQPLYSTPTASRVSVTIAENEDPFGVFGFANASAVTVDEGARATLGIVRRGGALGEVLLSWTATSVELTDAQLSQQLSKTSGLITVPAGVFEASLEFVVLEDDVPEFPQQLSIVLVKTFNGRGTVDDGTAEVAVTMAASDYPYGDPHGVFAFESTVPVQVTEPDSGFTSVRLKVLRAEGDLHTVTVDWEIDPAAGVSKDVAATAGSIVFPKGVKEGVVEVFVLADELDEPEEPFDVVLSLPGDGQLAEGRARVTVAVGLNGLPYGTVSLEQAEYRIEEPTASLSFIEMAIVRSGATLGAVECFVRLVSGAGDRGAAQLDVDFVGANPAITFAEGERRKAFKVYVYSDALPEEAESFAATLDAYSERDPRGTRVGLALGRDTATVVIEANDVAAGRFAMRPFAADALTEPSAADASLPAALEVEVERTAGAFGACSVAWAVLRNGAQFEASSGVVAFADGATLATFALRLRDDGEPELRQTAEVALTAVQGDCIAGQAQVDGAARAITLQENGAPRGLIGFDPVQRATVEETAVGTGRKKVFRIGRNVGQFGEVSVAWLAVGASPGATPSRDLARASGRISFAADQDFAFLVIEVLQDDEPELEEVFNITLLQVAGGAILAPETTATVVVPANQDPYGVAGLLPSHAALDVAEPPAAGDGRVVLPLVREADSGVFGDLEVAWTLRRADVSAAEPATTDIAPAQGRVVIPAGERDASIVLSVLHDDVPEGNEAFVLELVSVSGGGRLGARRTSLVTVLWNDDPLGRFSWVPPAAVEVGAVDEEATNVLRFAIARTGSDVGTVTVEYRTAPLSDGEVGNRTHGMARAADGQDYLGVDGSVTFTTGQSLHTFVNIPVVNDDLPEQLEGFALEITRVSSDVDPALGSPTLGDASRVVVRLAPNDDYRGVLEFARASVTANETAGYVDLVVVRGGGDWGEVSFQLGETELTAQNEGVDYHATRSVYTMADGQREATARVLLLDDAVPEIDEVFLVYLTEVQGGARAGQQDRVNVVIENNDGAYGRFGFDALSQLQILNLRQEGSTDRPVVLKVTRADGTFGAVEVPWRLEGTSAGAPDFVPSSGVLRFGIGARAAQLLLTVQDDGEPEFHEEIRVVLEGPSNGGVLRAGDAVAVLTVPANDDPHGVVELGAAYGWEADGVTRRLTWEAVRTKGAYADIVATSAVSFGEGSCGGVVTVSSAVMEEGQLRANMSAAVPEAYVLTPATVACVAIETVELAAGGHTATSEGRSPRLGATASLRASGVPPQLMRASTLAFVSAYTTAAEGDRVDLVIRRGPGLFGAVDLPWSMEFTAGAEAQDVVGNVTGGVARFRHGESSAAVSIGIREDGASELAEAFEVRLAAASSVPSTALVDADALVHRVEIAENGAPYGAVSFGAAAQQALLAEGEAVVSVYRREGSIGDMQVQWGTTAGQAKPSVDYVTAGGVLVFREGELSQNVTVTLLRTRAPVPSRRLYLNLFNPVGAVPSVKPVLGEFPEIAVDITSCSHCEVGFGPTAQFRAEEGATLRMPVVRTPDAFDEITIFFQIFGGTDPLRDFAVSRGELVLPVGVMESALELEVLDDAVAEYTRTFTVQITNIVGDSRLQTQSRNRAVVIPTDDQPYGLVEFEADGGDTVAVEGAADSTLAYTLTRGGRGRSNGDIVVTVEGGLEALAAYREHPRGVIGVGAVLSTGEERTVRHCARSCLYHASGLCVALDYEPEDNRCTLRTEAASTEVGEAGTGPASRFFTLDGRAALATPRYGEDYVLLTGDGAASLLPALEVRMRDGEERSAVSVRLLADTVPEQAERVELRITDAQLGRAASAGELAIGPRATQAFVVPANDEAAGVFGVTAEDPSVEEGGVVTLEVVRTRGLFGEAAVDWAIVFDGAAGASDVAGFISGQLLFADMQSRAPLRVQVVADGIPELREAFSVQVSFGNATAATTVHIEESDTPFGLVRFADGQPTVFEEPAAGEGLAVCLTVTRERGVLDDSQLAWEVAGPPGEDISEDFAHLRGTVALPRGEQAVPLCLTLLGDGRAELAEQYTLTATVAAGQARVLPDGPGGALSLVLTVPENDDPYGRLTFEAPDVRVGEAAGVLVVNVTRQQGLNGAVAVTVASVPGTAASAGELVDFVAVEETVLTFAPGAASASVAVEILDDIVAEGEEYFDLVLSAVAGGAVLGRFAQQRVHIHASDDGGEWGVYSLGGVGVPGQPVVREGQNNSVPVVRGGGDMGRVVVGYQVGRPRDTAAFEEPLDGQLSGQPLKTEYVPEATVDGCAQRCLAAARCLALSYSAQYNTCNLFATADRALVVGADDFSTWVKRVEQPLVFATPGDDFVAYSGSVVFEDRQAVAQIPVEVLDDDLPELAEVFGVRLLSARAIGASAGSIGAELGELTYVNVAIARSDSVHGRLELEQPPRPAALEEGAALEVVVQRRAGSVGAVSALWQVTCEGADAHGELEAAGGEVPFVDGQPQATVVLRARQDAAPERDTRCSLALVATTGGADVGGEPLALTLVASDNPSGSFGWVAPQGELAVEEGGTAALSVQRAGGALNAVTLAWEVADPAGGRVLSGLRGEVVFAPNQTSAVVTFTVPDDDEAQPAVELAATLAVAASAAAPDAYVRSGDAAVFFALRGSDDAVGFSLGSSYVLDEDAGQAVSVTVRRATVFEFPLERRWVVEPEAEAAAELVNTSGLVRFAAGEDTARFDLHPRDDGDPEYGRTLSVRLLQAPGAAAPLADMATLQVLGSDAPSGTFGFAADEVTVEETRPFVEVAVVRANGVDGEVAVTVAVVAGSATEGRDFEPLAGQQVVFADQDDAPKTVRVNLLEDGEPEPAEDLFVRLVSAVRADGLAGREGPQVSGGARQRIVIAANDNAGGVLALREADISVEEGAAAAITVQRTGSYFGEITLRWSAVTAAGVTAAGSSPYALAQEGGLPLDARAVVACTAPDGRALLLLETAQRVALYDGSGQLMQVFPQGNVSAAAAITTESALFLWYRQTVYLLDAAGVFVVAHPQTGSIREGAPVAWFTRDGGAFLAVAGDGGAEVYSVAADAMSRVWRGGGGGAAQAVSVTTGPSGQVMAYATGSTVWAATWPAGDDAPAEAAAVVTLPRPVGFAVAVARDGLANVTGFATDYILVAATVDGSTATLAAAAGQAGVPSLSVASQIEVGDFVAADLVPAHGAESLLAVATRDGVTLYKAATEDNRLHRVSDVPVDGQVQGFRASADGDSTLLAVATATQGTKVYRMGSLAAAADLYPGGGFVTMREGESSVNVNLFTVDDGAPEGREAFQVTLTPLPPADPNLAPTVAGNLTASVAIEASDAPYGTVSWTAVARRLDEADETRAVALELTRTRGEGAVVAAWEHSGSTGAILPRSGSVSFAEGETKAAVTLTVAADTVPELGEDFLFRIVSVSQGAAVRSPGDTLAASRAANDNPDGAVGFRSASRLVAAAEGDVVTLEVERVPDLYPLPVVLRYSVVGDNGLPVQDVTPTRGFIALGTAGLAEGRAVTSTIQLAVERDATPETEKRYSVRLETDEGVPDAPQLAEGAGVAVVTVAANENPHGTVQVAARDLVVDGASRYSTIQMSRTGGLIGTLRVRYRLSHAPAGSQVFTERRDVFSLDSADDAQTAFIYAGATSASATMLLLESAVVAAGDRLQVELEGVFLDDTGEPLVPGNASRASVVVDVASANGEVSFAPGSRRAVVAERAAAAAELALTVTRTGGFGDVDVAFQLSGAAAAAASLGPATGTVFLPSGTLSATVVLSLSPDEIPEPEVTVEVQLIAANARQPAVVAALAFGGRSSSVAVLPSDYPYGLFSVLPGGFGLQAAADGQTAHFTCAVQRTRGTVGAAEVAYEIHELAGGFGGSGDFEESGDDESGLSPGEGGTLLAQGTLGFADGMPGVSALVDLPAGFQGTLGATYVLRLVRAEAPGLTSGGGSGGGGGGEAVGVDTRRAFSSFELNVFAQQFGSFRMQLAQLTVSEGAGCVSLLVVRDQGSRDEAVVSFSVSGTATEGADYRLSGPRQLVFGDAETVRYAEVCIVDDDQPEPLESLYVTLVNVTGGGQLGAVLQTTEVSIQPSDFASGLVGFATQRVFTKEPAEGDPPTDVSLQVTRRGTSGNVTVFWTASSPDDVAASAGSVTLVEGQSSANISIGVIQDGVPELTEAFTVTLDRLQGGLPFQSKVDADAAVVEVVISHSDEPHGEFYLAAPEGLAVAAEPGTRYVEAAVLRRKGAMARVRASLRLTVSGTGACAWDECRPAEVDFANGQAAATLRLDVPNAYFLDREAAFTLTLTAVRLLDSQSDTAPVVAAGEAAVDIGVPAGLADGMFRLDASSGPLTVSEPAREPAAVPVTVERVGGLWSRGGPESASVVTFETVGGLSPASGRVVFDGAATTVTFPVFVMPDDEPELEERASVTITGVYACEAGCNDAPALQESASEHSAAPIVIIVPENDSPRGVVELAQRSVFTRAPVGKGEVALHIVRLAGLYGDVRVAYRAYTGEYDTYPMDVRGSVDFAEGQDAAVVLLATESLPGVASNFTVAVSPDEMSGEGARPEVGAQSVGAVYVPAGDISGGAENVVASTGAGGEAPACVTWAQEACVGLDNVELVNSASPQQVYGCLNEAIAATETGLCGPSVAAVNSILRGLVSRSSPEAPYSRELNTMILQVFSNLAEQPAAIPAVAQTLEAFAFSRLHQCNATGDTTNPRAGEVPCGCRPPALTVGSITVAAERTTPEYLDEAVLTFARGTDNDTQAAVAPGLQLPRSLSDVLLASAANPTAAAALCEDVQFSLMTNAGLVFPPAAGRAILDGSVVSVAVKGHRVANLIKTNQVQFTVPQSNPVQQPQCSFWDFDEGAWSQEGCGTVDGAEPGQVTCQCNHMTNYAVVAVSSKALPLHIFVGTGIVVSVLVVVLVTYARHGLTSSVSDVLEVNLLAALLGLFVVFIANAASTAAFAPAGVQFALGLLLHLALLAALVAMLALVGRNFRLVNLGYPREGGLTLKRFSLFATWIVPLLVAVLYCVFTLQAGFSVAETYGDVSRNRRISFLVQWPGMVGAFIAEAAVVSGVTLVLLALLAHRQLSWNRNQFTVEEAELVNMIQSRQVSFLAAMATLSMAVGVAATSASVVGLEYLFTVACVVQALHLLYFAYRKSEVAQQLRAGSFDPWKDVHGKQYAERAVPAASKPSVPMVHLPTSPLAGPVTPHPPGPAASSPSPRAHAAVDVPLRPEFEEEAARVAINPAYTSLDASPLPLHPSEVKLRPPRRGRPSSPGGAIGGFSSFSLEETLPDFEEAARQDGPGGGFDDLLYALRTGDVFSGDSGASTSSPLALGDAATTAETFDLRRVSIADTHL